MSANDEVTITVRRDDIEAIATWRAARHSKLTDHGRMYGLTTDPASRTEEAREALDRLLAAVPPPPWEPSEAQIDQFCTAYGWRLNQPVNRRTAVDNLKNLHAAGLVLP